MIHYKCPKCGEKENLHYNYDYSKQHRPVIDVTCNKCGDIFDGNLPASDLGFFNTSNKEISDWDVTLMDGLEDEDWYPYPQDPELTNIKTKRISDFNLHRQLAENVWEEDNNEGDQNEREYWIKGFIKGLTYDR